MADDNTTRWDHDLDGAALTIAGLEHTPLRVLAGPGTGKTFALMRRVARLLQQGATPKRVLVATFTRTAARDLQRELHRLAADGSRRVRAGTLHSLCFSLLASQEVLPLTGRIPRPLLAFEERFLREDVKGEPLGGLDDCAERLEAFNAAWARRQSEVPGWPRDPLDQEFHRRLSRWLGWHQSMLVGELVPLALAYLRDNPASPMRDAFDHVLVDEYQDLNRAEQDLLDLLSDRGSLTVVGDEDQSIYSFRYAHPEGIAGFHVSHENTHDQALDECRRCPRRVVTLANSLIAHNLDRAPRQLLPFPTNPEGEVQVIQWETMETEVEGLGELINQRVGSGQVDPGEVLVLTPSRKLGYAIRNALNARNVRALSFFHEEVLDGNPCLRNKYEAQKAFTLLTLLANPADRVALRCWCGFGSPSLRSGAWARLMEHCDLTGESPAAALQRMAREELSLPHTGELVTMYRQLQASLLELRPLRGPDIVEALFPEGEEWTTFIRASASAIFADEYDAQALREHLRISITQPELPTDVEYVRVMSLHKSKGLTAQFVVVAGCIDRLIPRVKGSTPEEKERSLQEQRRLFYVAVTRTKQSLVLSSFTRMLAADAYALGIPVRPGIAYARTRATSFLGELGPELPRADRGN